MKVGPTDTKQAVTSVASERSPAPAAKSGGARATPASTRAVEASAQVELSAAAASLNESAVSKDFDARKVERIAQAIRDGKLKVDAEAVADKLLQSTRELLESDKN